jgi:hypothetical protein
MIVSAVGTALLVVGSFLTWATVSIDLGRFADALGVDVGTIRSLFTFPRGGGSVSGFAADGEFTLIAGILIAGCLLLARVRPGSGAPIGVAVAVLGLIGAGVAAYDRSEVVDAQARALGDLAGAVSGSGLDARALGGVVTITPGIGLWLGIVGGIAAVVGGALLIAGRRTAPGAATSALVPSAQDGGAG